MASPGIRFWEFARVLSDRFQVSLIMPPWVPVDEEATFEGAPAPVQMCNSEEDLKLALENCDILVTQGVTLYFHPFLRHINKPLVLDIYVPMLLEDLERAPGDRPGQPAQLQREPYGSRPGQSSTW